MPKVESSIAIEEIRVQALSRAVRTIMGEMCKRRWPWIYGSQYLYVFVILPKLPRSTLYKATH